MGPKPTKPVRENSSEWIKDSLVKMRTIKAPGSSLLSQLSERVNLGPNSVGTRKSGKMLSRTPESPIAQPGLQSQNSSIRSTMEDMLFGLYRGEKKDILERILQFLMEDYGNLHMVSAKFYIMVTTTFDSMFSGVEEKFVAAYSSYFRFKGSYNTSSTYTHKGFKHTRLFRNIICELDPATGNNTLIFGFKCKNVNSKKEEKHFFKIDAIGSKNRTLWIFKDDTSHNFDAKKTAFVQPILPISHGDAFKFSICFYTLGNFIDLKTIEWTSMAFLDIPKSANLDFEEKMIPFDAARHCEAEEMIEEWVEQNNIPMNLSINFDTLKPHLQFHKSLYAYGGMHAYKTLYTAAFSGLVPSSTKDLGIDILISKADAQLTNEIKEMGLWTGYEKTLHLREGDNLILYYITDEFLK